MKVQVIEAILILDNDEEVMVHRDHSSGEYTAVTDYPLDEDQLVEVANYLNKVKNGEKVGK